MPGTTGTYGFPYLEPDDPPDIASATQDLAEAVEAELLDLQQPAPVEGFQTANDTMSTTSYVGGTSHGVAFTAPDSGKVYVTFGGDIGHNSAVLGVTAYLSDVVRTGSTVGSGTTVMGASDERAGKYVGDGFSAAGFRYRYVTVRHLVTGLTPGNSYNVVTVFRADTGGATAAVNDRRLLVEPVV